MASHNAPPYSRVASSRFELHRDAAYHTEMDPANGFDYSSGSAASSYEQSKYQLSAREDIPLFAHHYHTSPSISSNHRMNNSSFSGNLSPHNGMAFYVHSSYSSSAPTVPFNSTSDRHNSTLALAYNANMNTPGVVNPLTAVGRSASYSYSPYQYPAVDNSSLSSSYQYPSVEHSVDSYSINKENMNTTWNLDHRSMANTNISDKVSHSAYSPEDESSLIMPMSSPHQQTHIFPPANIHNIHAAKGPQISFFSLPPNLHTPNTHEEQRQMIELMDQLMERDAAVKAQIMLNEMSLITLGRRARRLERASRARASEESGFEYGSPEKTKRNEQLKLTPDSQSEDEALWDVEDGGFREELWGEDAAADGANYAQTGGGVARYSRSEDGGEEVEQQHQQQQQKREIYNAEVEYAKKVEAALEEVNSHYQTAQQKIRRNEARIEWLERELVLREEEEKKKKKKRSSKVRKGVGKNSTSKKRGKSMAPKGSDRVYKETPVKRVKR